MRVYGCLLVMVDGGVNSNARVSEPPYKYTPTTSHPTFAKWEAVGIFLFL